VVPLFFPQSLCSPDKRQLPDLRDISNYILRLFFWSHGHLRLELAVTQANSVHPQLFAGSDFAHGPVADDQNFSRLQSSPRLDLAECRLFGEYVATVGKINLLDRGLAVEPQSFHFCVLGFRFAKADDEISNASFRQKAQQRQRSGKEREFPDRAIEIAFARRAADFFRILRAEMA